MTDPLTIVFMPESAYGPTNNCIGIGKILEQRSHRVVFAAEASWRGRLEPLGFEEDLVDLAPPAEGDQDAGHFWTDFITETAPEFRKPTIEQLDTFIEPVWASLITKLHSAFISKERKSKFVEPMTENRPSATSVLACSPAAWYSKIRTPRSMRSE